MAKEAAKEKMKAKEPAKQEKAKANGPVEPRLFKRYRESILPQLMREFGYTNVLAAPKLVRIVVSMGVKEGGSDIKILDGAANDLELISGQKPKICRAKKSVSGFKLREGAPIGLMVTLRRSRMYEFLDRLVSVAMPRIRDFKGVNPKSFDGRGNYSFGLEEQIIFPEIEYDKIPKIQGMNVTFVMNTRKDEEARRLLELLGLPFRKQS